MATAQHPHFDHLLKVGMLHKLSRNPKAHKRVRSEARKELAWYRAQGQQILDNRQEHTVAKKKEPEVDVSTHATRVYSGRGVLFCVADDRESLGSDGTTVGVIAAAIEDALDNGQEDSEAIARWLVTSSFSYEPDKRVRFNSLLRAGDAVGAQMTRKLYNAYNELVEMAADEELDPTDRKLAKAEATGFAEAISVVTSPFSCEDPENAHLVNWDMVDHVTALFEKEQIQVRRARKGNPQ